MIVSFRRHMLLHLDGNNHTYVHESADIERRSSWNVSIEQKF